ncbi:hypothetical protein N9E20_03150, partial [Crocinitomicaceae bacterium]|nr:hypothetical protein [Crocinitomicaceae bacterium]
MLEYHIKDISVLEKEEDSEYKGKHFTLKYGSYLGDVLTQLPSGRIDKRETGIGATHLELQCKRNSIIVQPLKVTAETKAKGKDGIKYFGDIEGAPMTIGKLLGTEKETKLIQYIKDDSYEFKKISIVADNLPKLINILVELGIDVYNEYFLLIDEIDSIQKDSSFRGRMNACMEIYKKFNKKNRAVISATLIDFSDPEIVNDPLTVFQYTEHIKGHVDIIHTTTLLETSIEKIISALSTGEKLLVAINSLKDIQTIAHNLNKESILSYDEITVLCGSNKDNKEKIKKFRSASITDNQLPNKLNFITSAFFTGYDLY